MAICRCEKCGRPVGRKGNVYDGYVVPLGYPRTSSICGTKNCYNPGLIWLDQDDIAAYKGGGRIVPGATNSMKYGVDDTGIVFV